MRKTISLFTILINLTVALSVFAGSVPGTGIYQSAHDLTNGQGGSGASLSVPGFVTDPQQRLCAYCHTPHHAITQDIAEANGANDLSLWSHEVSTVNFIPYMSATFTPKGGVSMSADPLGGPSRLCMSCHDGVTAVDNYYGLTSGHFMVPLGTQPYPDLPVISFNGNKSHPIGFVMTDVIPNYPGASNQDSNILPLSDLSIFATGNANTSPTIISRLFGGLQMTCSTCHDVHNSLNKVAFQAGDKNYMLLGAQTNSINFCLSCHTLASGVSGRAHNWP